MYLWGCTCHRACVEVRGQLVGVCSFYCVGPRDGIKMVRFGGSKYLYLPRY